AEFRADRYLHATLGPGRRAPSELDGSLPIVRDESHNGERPLARVEGARFHEPARGAGDRDAHRQPLLTRYADLGPGEGLAAGVLVALQARRELLVVLGEQALAECIVTPDAIGFPACQVDLFIGVAGEVVQFGLAGADAPDEFPVLVAQPPLFGDDVL